MSQNADKEPLYGGHTRFELELEVRPNTHTTRVASYQTPDDAIINTCLDVILIDVTDHKQFVQSLSNPLYLNHLAAQKLLDNPEFVAYLNYLQYFAEPKYIKYLS